MNEEQEADKIVDKLKGNEYTYLKFNNNAPIGQMISLIKIGQTEWVIQGDNNGYIEIA